MDVGKPELRWQKAIQWGCNWPQGLKHDLENKDFKGSFLMCCVRCFELCFLLEL